jgi:phage tail sheath gpL-like
MASPILFNFIPGSGLVAPIFSFEVNSGGQFQQLDRFILVGFPTSAGTIVLNKPTVVGSQQQADTLAGPGSQLREMYRVASRNAPAAPIWLLAISDSALTGAVWTITVGSFTGLTGVGTIIIAGETIQVPIGAADTPTTIAAALSNMINSYYNNLTGAMLPITTTTAAGVITATARNKGAFMNELDYYVPPNLVGNIFASTGVITIVATTPGAGTPTTVSTALGDLGDSPADYVVCPFADTTNLGVYQAFDSDVSGRWAWDQQAYGHVWTATVGTLSSLTTLGLTLNDRHTSIIGCMAPGPNGTPHGSWLWVSAIAAMLQPWLSDTVTGNVSRNQTGLELVDILPPRDSSIVPTYTARNTLLSSGISTWNVAADGGVTIDKIISTYRVGTSGQPDTVFRDIQALYQVAGGLKFLRAFCATAFGQKALANTNPGLLGAIATPADIKAGFIQAYTQLAAQGVFQDPATFANLLNVQINAGNPDRVDVFLPLERVAPLDILAANATIYQVFPATTATSPAS